MKISTYSICVFKNAKGEHFFFHHLKFTEGSGSKIPDFQFEDPDPKLLISDTEHCKKMLTLKTTHDMVDRIIKKSLKTHIFVFVYLNKIGKVKGIGTVS